MSSKPVVKFENVTKVYSRVGGIHQVKNFLDRIKNAQFNAELLEQDPFRALTNVSFEINKGERIGIIGSNGAGKSTTLKLLNGIANPSSGRISISGKVGGMLELGSGFHPDLTGRENVFLNTAIQGMSKAQTEEIFARILEISELHEFIDIPIKRYSSGMKVRLGFAVALSTVPDIILLDEVLSVGDERFRKKSLLLVKEYLAGRTLVFVSHSLGQVKEVCERVLVLNGGQLIYDGPPQDAIDFYLDDKSIKRTWLEKTELVQGNVKRGYSEVPTVEVTSVNVDRADREGNIDLRGGDKIKLGVHFSTKLNEGTLLIKVQLKKLMMDRFSETISGKVFERIAGENLDQFIEIEFDGSHLYTGNYILEVIPQFKDQSPKAALMIFKKKLHLTCLNDSNSVGMIDLAFSELSGPTP